MLARCFPAHELWWLGSNRSPLGHFGKLLGLRLPADGGKLELCRLEGDSSVVVVPYPDMFGHQEGGAFRLGTAIAMADEISTFAGMAMWDRRARPGVSIALSAQLSSGPVPRVSPGDLMTFETRLVKAGEQLGFLSFEVRLGETVVARGRHTKFLSPPGLKFRALSLAFQPAWQRTTMDAALRLLRRRPLVPPPDVRLDASLGVRPTAVPSEFEVELSSVLANPMGSLHGGAAGMIGESAAAAAYVQAHGEPAPPARMVHISLHSALPHGRTTLSVAGGERTLGHAQAAIAGADRREPRPGEPCVIRMSHAGKGTRRGEYGAAAAAGTAVEVLLWR